MDLSCLEGSSSPAETLCPSLCVAAAGAACRLPRLPFSGDTPGCVLHGRGFEFCQSQLCANPAAARGEPRGVGMSPLQAFGAQEGLNPSLLLLGGAAEGSSGTLLLGWTWWVSAQADLVGFAIKTRGL